MSDARLADTVGMDDGKQLLTSEEEYTLVCRIRSSRDAVAAEALITAHRPLAQRLALRYLWTNIPYIDLLDAAMFGVRKAAFEFDPDRGNRFAAYAWSAINNTIRDDLLAKNPPYTVSLDGPAFPNGVDVFSEPRLLSDDYLIAKETLLEELDEVVIFFRALDSSLGLSERDKEIFKKRYDFDSYDRDGRGETKGTLCDVDELAVLYGVSRQAISKVLDRIWSKAKEKGFIASWKELRSRLAFIERLRKIVDAGG